MYHDPNKRNPPTNSSHHNGNKKSRRTEEDYRYPPYYRRSYPILYNTTEQPLFVNQVQFEVIKKRKARRDFLDTFMVDTGKNGYLHESRHRHAMNRARAASGRFLTKAETEALKKQKDQENAAAKYSSKDAQKSQKHNIEQNTHSNDPSKILLRGANVSMRDAQPAYMDYARDRQQFVDPHPSMGSYMAQMQLPDILKEMTQGTITEEVQEQDQSANQRSAESLKGENSAQDQGEFN